VGTHLAHELSELFDVFEQGHVVQVLEHLLPVAHGASSAKVAEQDIADQVGLVAIARDGCHDLIEVQIRRDARIRILFSDGVDGPRSLEQQARESAIATVRR
jgi:hypothetical protein